MRSLVRVRTPVSEPAPPARPARFRRHRWLGDKRAMVVHDLDGVRAACRLDDLLASERCATFGPDSLPEARNRGYRPCPHCTRHTG